ncbi:MAG: sigma-70 family RNA polymerase sigma factor [Pseudomonadota bacterium]
MQTGDTSLETSLEALYIEHHGWLIGWINKRVSCSEQARDFAQDTFLRVTKQRQQISNLRRPRAYLSSIARNLLVDWFRRRSIEQAYYETLAQQPEGYEISAEERCAIVETLYAIDLMLSQLSERRRTIFLLAQMDGLKFVDIARRLRLSVTTVRKHYIAALTQCLLLSEE